MLVEFQATRAGSLALPRLTVLAEDGAEGHGRPPLPLARRGGPGGRAPGGSRRRAERPPHPDGGAGVGRCHPGLRPPDDEGRPRRRRWCWPRPAWAGRAPASTCASTSRAPGPTPGCWAPTSATARQTLDYRYFVGHRAPHTTSNMYLKGAVGDAARSVFTGLIRIEPEGQGSDAMQTNRNLVLAEGAAGPLGAQPGDPGQRGALRPRLHRQPPRRRAALLPDEPGPRSRPGRPPAGEGLLRGRALPLPPGRTGAAAAPGVHGPLRGPGARGGRR